MDLQDFDRSDLYFDTPLSPEVAHLLTEASEGYAEGTAEQSLLAADRLAPDNLTVLVGLYRFYYYQHRYPEALSVAERVMHVLATPLGLPERWQNLTPELLPHAAQQSMGSLRFYLLALKGAGYLNLRLGRFEQGKNMLLKVATLDTDNRLGAQLLLDVLNEHSADILTFPRAETRS